MLKIISIFFLFNISVMNMLNSNKITIINKNEKDSILIEMISYKLEKISLKNDTIIYLINE